MGMEEIVQGNFSRSSAPSELRITDIRFTDIVGAPMHCTLMKIYTDMLKQTAKTMLFGKHYYIETEDIQNHSPKHNLN